MFGSFLTGLGNKKGNQCHTGANFTHIEITADKARCFWLFRKMCEDEILSKFIATGTKFGKIIRKE